MLITPINVNTIVKRNHSSFENVILIDEHKQKYKILAWDDFVFIYNISNGNIIEIGKNTLREDYKIELNKTEYKT